jgi:hypothetical protein
MVSQRICSRGCEKSSLAHASTKEFTKGTGLLDETFGPSKAGTNRRSLRKLRSEYIKIYNSLGMPTQSLAKAKADGMERPTELVQWLARLSDHVPQSSSVQMHVQTLGFS